MYPGVANASRSAEHGDVGMALGDVGVRRELADLCPDDDDSGVAEDLAPWIHRQYRPGPDDEIRGALAGRLGHVVRVAYVTGVLTSLTSLTSNAALKNHWYAVAKGHVAVGAPISAEVLGVKLAIWRAGDSAPRRLPRSLRAPRGAAVGGRDR